MIRPLEREKLVDLSRGSMREDGSWEIESVNIGRRDPTDFLRGLREIRLIGGAFLPLSLSLSLPPAFSVDRSKRANRIKDTAQLLPAFLRFIIRRSFFLFPPLLFSPLLSRGEDVHRTCITHSSAFISIITIVNISDYLATFQTSIA